MNLLGGELPADAFAASDLEVLAGLLAPVPDEPNRLALTVQGRLLTNEVALRLRLPS